MRCLWSISALCLALVFGLPAFADRVNEPAIFPTENPFLALCTFTPDLPACQTAEVEAPDVATDRFDIEANILIDHHDDLLQVLATPVSESGECALAFDFNELVSHVEMEGVIAMRSSEALGGVWWLLPEEGGYARNPVRVDVEAETLLALCR